MPHLRLILRPGLPKCKSNCTRVAAHYNGGFKIKTPLANCPLPHPTLQSQRVKYLQIGIIFSNCTSQPPSLPSSREERSLTYYCSEEELRDLGPAVGERTTERKVSLFPVHFSPALCTYVCISRTLPPIPGLAGSRISGMSLLYNKN